MERYFELELDKLNKRVLKMAELVSEQIRDTMAALRTCDTELARKVVENDRVVDKLDVKIDKLCQRIFALTQPVASDLRLIMSALRMNNDLERMGDHAVGIARRIENISEYREILEDFGIADLTSRVEVIVADVNAILVRRNTAMVRDIFKDASRIEEKSQEITARILSEMMCKKEVIVVAANLIIMLTQLERIAGYATNIAESIVFIVDGKMIKHKHPKEEEEES